MCTRNLLSCISLLIVFIVAGSCELASLNATGDTYLDLEAIKPDNDPTNDTIEAITTLGRVLFYDRQMSVNNTIACASCHKQAYGFADNQRFSRGFENRVTSRNSMPIQNLTNGIMFFDAAALDIMPSSSLSPFLGSAHFFWDGREQDLQSLVLQPVGNHIEMGITDIDVLTKKLSALPYYAPLFKNAFGKAEITKENLSTSIKTFIETITSSQTKLDKYNQLFASDAHEYVLSPLELEGMTLFREKYDCNSCHQVDQPNGYVNAGTFANIGLDRVYSDPGLEAVTGNSQDNGKFKIPSLRNVAYTAPYMHDGRFETLEDVIDHYSEGIADNPNLDNKLKDGNGNTRSMNISEHEKEAIIAFLHALNDETVITDPRYSNPFKTK